MKPQAGIRIDLRALPRSQDRTNLGTDNAVRVGSRVEHVIGLHIETIDVTAQAECGSQLATPLDFALAEESNRRLSNAVYSCRIRSLSRDRMIERDIADSVMSNVRSESILQIESADSSETAMRDLATRHPAAIFLFELVAVQRVVEEVGKIRKQIQPIAQHI